MLCWPSHKNPTNFCSWKIRIGNNDHNSSDDEGMLILDIKLAYKHPLYDNVAEYYDIAVLTTEAVTFTKVGIFDV